MNKFRLQDLIDNMPHGLDRAILGILSYHKGEKNAISRQELMETLAANGFNYWTGKVDENGQKIYADRQVRAQINQMRKSAIPICAKSGTNGGYFWPVHWSELDDFIAKELHGKAMDLLEQEKILRQAGEKLWGKYSPAKQISLF